MHELALARSLIDLIDETLASNGHAKVKRINLRLGQASALARALHFCFGPASRGTRCEGAVLQIEEVPMTVRCQHCNGVKEPRGRYSFRCPDCGFTCREIVTGREMILESIELHESDRDSRQMQISTP